MTFTKYIINFFQIIFLILFSNKSFAQSGVEIDSMLVIASELVYSKPAMAEKIAVMVSENDNDPTKKIEILFILSQINYQNSDYQSALEQLYLIENLSKNRDDNDFWNVRLNFDLAKIYRDLQIFYLAEKHFRRANQLFHRINHPSQTLIALFNYENATNTYQNGDYKESNLYLRQSLSANGNILHLSNLGLGTNYIHTYQPDSAIIYFSKIPSEVEILNTSSLVGMAKSLLLKNDWNSAEKYLINALNRSSTLQTKKEIYHILSQNYLKEKNINLHEVYKLKYDSVDNVINTNLYQARNLIIKHTELKNHDDENDGNEFLAKILFFIIGVIIISAIPLIYYYLNTQSDYKKYQRVVNQISIEQISNSETEKEKQLVIPEKSEQQLLKKLNRFEQSENYLNPKISLTTLAKQLDTNTKYLSEVVNKNKDKNFNSYINELRINYIVQKLKNDTKYRNYKVMSLAEECGYSSHSTFISAFRSVIGISPSSFINFLKKEKNP